jgi:hypothetical protein
MPLATPAIPVVPEEARWAAAAQSVNAWRGQLVQAFASTEAAVSEALLGLSSVPGRGDHVRLRHLIGPRFQDLADALDASGPFSAEGAVAASCLAAFRVYEPLRTVLGHGVFRIAIDRRDRWVVIAKVVTFRTKGAERTLQVFEQDDAERMAAEVRSLGQKVSSSLGNLTRLVSSAVAAVTEPTNEPSKSWWRFGNGKPTK